MCRLFSGLSDFLAILDHHYFFLDIPFCLPGLDTSAGLSQRRPLVALNAAGKWVQ